MEELILEKVTLYINGEISQDELYKVVIEYTDKIKLRPDTYLASVIAGANYADDEKIELFSLFPLETAKVILIESLQDCNNKLKQLKNIEDEHNKVSIILTISDEKLKIKLMEEEIQDGYSKAKIISSIKDKKLKINLMEKYLTDDQHIAMVINSIENKKLQISLIKDYAKKMPQFYALLFNISSGEAIKALNVEKQPQIGLPPDMSIGLELEFELRELSVNEREFRSEQIKERDFILKYLNKWLAKEDTSLRDKEGLELNSPVFYDTSEMWTRGACVCEIMKKNDFIANERTALHINIGGDYLKNLDEWKNLYRIWCVSEDIFYRISDEEGETIRSYARTFAKKINPKFEETEKNGTIQIDSVEDVEEFIEQLKDATKTSEGFRDREYGLNLLDVNNKDKNRVEIRIPNGSLNPKIIMENVKLYGKLFEVSKAIVTDENLRSKYNRLISKKFDSEEDKLNALLNLLFDEQEDKDIFLRRWKSIEGQKNVFEESRDQLS